MNVDVVVVGSGAGALVAANAAAAQGAEVVVLEKSGLLGGGSALSTGLVWAPANSHMGPIGIDDSVDEGIQYLARINGGSLGPERLATFLTTEHRMLEFLQSDTPVKLRAIANLPDFYPDLAGGKLGGRHLAAEPVDGPLLGDWADRTRRSQSLPLTFYEIEAMGGPAKVRQWDFNLIAERFTAGVRAQGAGLVAGLVLGCLKANVALRTNAPVTNLISRDGRVAGVAIQTADGPEHIDARRAVILGTGGFEWNASMNRAFLGHELSGALTVPSNEGDGHRMAVRLGASLALMQEAAWTPTIQIPGESYEGRPYYRNLISEKGRPHGILVNRAGQRFVNESLNYADMGHAFRAFAPGAYEYPNRSPFFLFDSAYKSTYPVATAMPGEAAPEWLHEAPTLAALADDLGIDGRNLERTVARFNGFAAAGVDEDFGRGLTAFERYYGDAANSGPNASLGALDSPPYYAVEVGLGSLGNRGGVLVTDEGNVLDIDGHPMAGLYACGNTAAQLALGRGYEGGGTLALSMTYGYAAGLAAAKG